MFCTACAATNAPTETACTACGVGMWNGAAFRIATTRPRRPTARGRLLRALYAAPFVALLALAAVAGGQRWQAQQAMAAAYEEGVAAATAGDHLAALTGFEAAGGYADAPARRDAASAIVGPARGAYFDGLAALESGDYAASIDALLPVARDMPGLADATTRLADARRLETERLWRLVESADARRDWTSVEARLREIASLDPADSEVRMRLAALGRERGPLLVTRDRSLWLVGPDGADATLVAENVGALWPAWSPDRSRIAFLAIDAQSASGLVSLMVVDASGGSPRHLADGVSAHTAPAWSPDGRSLAFTSFANYDPFQDEGPIGVHVVDLASGREADVTGEEFDLAFNPVWSPDGREIVFVARERDLNERPQHAPGDVYQTALGSGEFRNLTDGSIRDAWSVHPHPAGGPLLIFSLYGQSWYEPPVTAIRALVPGRPPTAVSSPNEQVGAPVWSPDGRRFAYTVNEVAVRVTDLETGASTLHETEHPLAGEITWSPDGSALLAAALNGRQPSALLAFDEAGGATVTVVPVEYDSESPYFGPPQWAPVVGPEPSDDRSLGGTGLDPAG